MPVSMARRPAALLLLQLAAAAWCMVGAASQPLKLADLPTTASPNPNGEVLST